MAIPSATAEARTIARAAERLTQVTAEVPSADTPITIAALTAIAAATSDTLDDVLTQVLDAVKDGARQGAHGPDPVREVVWLRTRLVGARSGWLDRRAVLEIPVLVLDENLQEVGERTVALTC